MASVATMTGTMVDSGCKHIIPVRVSMDTLLSLSHDTDQNKILRDKMRFCAHKNDLLLCVNKPIFAEGRGALTKNAAYPYVVSTLGDIHPYVQCIIGAFFRRPQLFVDDDGKFSLAAFEQNGGLDAIDKNACKLLAGGVDLPEEEKKKMERLLQHLPLFSFMGYSLGLGYAHPSSGDNVVSSMIGGMITVQNGHYEACTGDLIMWYFEFEVPFFDQEGRRPKDAAPATRKRNRDEIDRERTHKRELGKWDQGFEKTVGKVNVAFPKPYYPDYSKASFDMDKMRIFAKAVSNARPFDKIDLLICTQSI